jgi:hypothetical protein
LIVSLRLLRLGGRNLSALRIILALWWRWTISGDDGRRRINDDRLYYRMPPGREAANDRNSNRRHENGRIGMEIAAAISDIHIDMNAATAMKTAAMKTNSAPSTHDALQNLDFIYSQLYTHARQHQTQVKLL